MSSTRKPPGKILTKYAVVISVLALLIGFILGKYIIVNDNINTFQTTRTNFANNGKLTTSQLLNTSDWMTYSFTETVEGFGAGKYTTSFKYPSDWEVSKQKNEDGCEYYMVKKSTAGVANGLLISNRCTEGDDSVPYLIPEDPAIVHIRNNAGVSGDNTYTLRFASGQDEFKFVSSLVDKNMTFNPLKDYIYDYVMTSTAGFAYSVDFRYSPDMADQSISLLQVADTIVSSLDSSQ